MCVLKVSPKKYALEQYTRPKRQANRAGSRAFGTLDTCTLAPRRLQLILSSSCARRQSLQAHSQALPSHWLRGGEPRVEAWLVRPHPPSEGWAHLGTHSSRGRWSPLALVLPLSLSFTIPLQQATFFPTCLGHTSITELFYLADGE